ncbi:MAG: DUF3501 family protein [Steroidobacteraceae bacterium]
MRRLTQLDLMSLEQYARERPGFRTRLIEHRRARALALGEHCSWSFEDRLSVQYQVQEMLRAERIFEPEGIAEELAVYNPLIPDGSNLKATLMIEYPDHDERVQRLAELRGFEQHCWMRVAGHDPVYAIADEDLPRESDTKTAAVHFLRFEFAAPMIATLKGGAALGAGVDHPRYDHSVEPLPQGLRDALVRDFD